MAPNARGPIGEAEYYHLITRGNNRMTVFHDETDFRRYLQFIRIYKEKFPVFLYHYCLMSNHVHLLVKVVDAPNLSKFMQGLNQSYANHYRRVHRHTGHLWQGRFKSFHIGQESYLLECGRYIERNPVRAAMVNTPADWPWSSYRHFALGVKNDLIAPHPLYPALGDTAAERQTAYQGYLLSERPYETLIDRQFIAEK